MSVWNALLLMLGVLILLVIICLAAVWLEKKFPGKNFDERQKIARGNANRLSSGVGMLYYLVVFTVMVWYPDISRFVEPSLLIFLGLELQVMVWHIYCIITHASIPLAEKPGVTVDSFLFVGAMYLTMSRPEPLSLVGSGSNRLIWLSLGVFYGSLAVMHILSLLRRERE